MARCGKCRRNKKFLMGYGGVGLCPYCYDDCNPQLHTYKLLEDSSKSRLEEKKYTLEKELRDINDTLDRDKKMRDTGVSKITVKIPRPDSFFSND